MRPSVAILLAAAAMAEPIPMGFVLAAEPGVIVHRALVPSVDRPQGEVRVVERDGAREVEVVLRTRILERVVGRIREKELASWPPDRDGYQSALRYVAALEDAVRRVSGPSAPGLPRASKRRPLRSLRIEFGGGSVLLSSVDVVEGEGKLDVTGSRPLVTLDLAEGYVERNMRLIVADAFGLPLEEAERLLVPGGGAGRSSEP